MKLYCKDNGHSYGAIGVKTPLIDKNGHQLRVGDVVILRNKSNQWSKLRFVAYDYRTKNYYIMGNYQGGNDFECEFAISHEMLSDGFGIGNVYYAKG